MSLVNKEALKQLRARTRHLCTNSEEIKWCEPPTKNIQINLVVIRIGLTTMKTLMENVLTNKKVGIRHRALKKEAASLQESLKLVCDLASGIDEAVEQLICVIEAADGALTSNEVGLIVNEKKDYLVEEARSLMEWRLHELLSWLKNPDLIDLYHATADANRAVASVGCGFLQLYQALMPIIELPPACDEESRKTTGADHRSVSSHHEMNLEESALVLNPTYTRRPGREDDISDLDDFADLDISHHAARYEFD